MGPGRDRRWKELEREWCLGWRERELRRRLTLGLRGMEMTGIGHAERDDVVWNKTGGVQVDDQEPEAGESFLSLERMA